MSKSRQLSDAINSVDISESAPADAVTLDASGNLLVGKTSASFSTAGHELRAGAAAIFVRDGNDCLSLNRLNSDGDIAKFSKDGTTVGSIGVDNNDNLFIEGTSTHAGLQFGTSTVIPHKNGATSDATVDLGVFNQRFQDLYLSGGVYLGGTGAANYLDDYEEGTWTPSYVGTSTAGTVTYVDRGGSYTKIGNQVTAYFSMSNFSVSGAAGNVRVTGLPFSGSFPSGTRGAYSGNLRMYRVDINTGTFAVNIGVDNGVNYIEFLAWKDNDVWVGLAVENDSNQYIEGYITYTTA